MKFVLFMCLFRFWVKVLWIFIVIYVLYLYKYLLCFHSLLMACTKKEWLKMYIVAPWRVCDLLTLEWAHLRVQWTSIAKVYTCCACCMIFGAPLFHEESVVPCNWFQIISFQLCLKRLNWYDRARRIHLLSGSVHESCIGKKAEVQVCGWVK